MSKAKGKKQLTDRQKKAIPFLVSSATYTEGCKKAKINKTTLYKWLKEPLFRKELDKQRGFVAAEAFGVLSQALTKAVENLVGLIDNTDDRVRRLACKDLIEFFLKHKEAKDLEERVTEVEKRLAETK
jgi:hypothetical protein